MKSNVFWLMFVGFAIGVSGCGSLNQGKLKTQAEKPDYCTRPVLTDDGAHIIIPFISDASPRDGIVYLSSFLGLEIINVNADTEETIVSKLHVMYNMIDSTTIQQNGTIVYLVCSNNQSPSKHGWCLTSTSDLGLKGNDKADNETKAFVLSRDVKNVLITYRICFPSGGKSPIRKVLLMEVDKVWNQPWSTSVKKDVDK